MRSMVEGGGRFRIICPPTAEPGLRSVGSGFAGSARSERCYRAWREGKPSACRKGVEERHARDGYVRDIAGYQCQPVDLRSSRQETVDQG
jgi:hypothetical protein